MQIEERPPRGPLERAFQKLERDGYCVIDGFASSEDAAACVFEMEALRRQGALRAAQIGAGRARQLRTDVRSSFLHWFEERSLSPVQRRIWTRIDALRRDLKSRFRLPLDPEATEAHYAIYPAGAFYARHRDNFEGDPGEAPRNNRILTFVLYLNQAWRPEHEGELRIYVPRPDDAAANDNRPRMIDIQPVAGTLALFDSLSIEHEILPTRVERRSICGWLCSPRSALRV